MKHLPLIITVVILVVLIAWSISNNNKYNETIAATKNQRVANSIPINTTRETVSAGEAMQAITDKLRTTDSTKETNVTINL